MFSKYEIYNLSLFCWTRIGIAFENSTDPDLMASDEAIWSGCTLLVIQFVNLYEQTTELSDSLTVRNGCGKLNLFSKMRI